MGVLSGYRVIELAGIGPGPMCAMLLSDMGADVLRIDRMADAGLGIAMDQKYSLLNRGRRSVAFDLKKPEAIEAVLLREGLRCVPVVDASTHPIGIVSKTDLLRDRVDAVESADVRVAGDVMTPSDPVSTFAPRSAS